MATKKTTPELFAVIQIGPRQYLVKQGDKLVIDKLDLQPGKTLTVKEVLLLTDGDKTTIGQPHVKDASVDLKLEKTDKGDKLRVARYRAKSRYRRVVGFRPMLSSLTVTAIKQK